MSTKVKIGIAIIVALGAAYAFWPRDDENKLPDVPEARVGQATTPAEAKTAQAPLKTAEATAKVAEKKPEAESTVISLEPARGSIVGRVTKMDDTPIPGATVTALR